MNLYEDEVSELRRIQDLLRPIRDRTSDLKTNANDGYLGLSGAVSGINKAIDDVLKE